MARIDYRNSDGQKVLGTTTIEGYNLGWSKNILVAWAKKFTKEASLETFKVVAGPDKAKEFATLLDANLKKKEAGPLDIGTLTHSMVEGDIKGKPLPEITDDSIKQKVDNGFLAWLEWKDQVKFELIKSEISLVSEEWQYGGTIDIVALIKGIPAIIDVKTGDTYPEHRVQIRAYGTLWNENFPNQPIQSYYLLRLGKDDGGFSYHYCPQLDDEWEVFKLLLQLESYRKKIK